MFQNWVQAARYVSESKPHNIACYGIRSKLYDLLQNLIQTLWYFPEFDSQNLTSLAPELCVTKCPPEPLCHKVFPRALCHKVSPPRTLVSQSVPLVSVCVCVCVCVRFPEGTSIFDAFYVWRCRDLVLGNNSSLLSALCCSRSGHAQPAQPSACCCTCT